MKIFTVFICIVIGVCFVYYRKKIVDTFGKNAWAEKVFGPGGSYLMWQLIGILIIFFSLMYSTGVLDRLVKGFFGKDYE